MDERDELNGLAELTERDKETLRKVEALLVSPASAQSRADALSDVAVALVSTVPQADAAFRTQLEARLVAKLEQRSGSVAGRPPAGPQRSAKVAVWRRFMPVPVGFGRVASRVGSVLVGVALVAMLVFALIFLLQLRPEVMQPGDRDSANVTPIVITPTPPLIEKTAVLILPTPSTGTAVYIPGGTPGPRATSILGSGCWGEWNVTLGPGTDIESSSVVDVAAISANDAWAVASVGNEGDSIIIHWDGTSWETAPELGKSADGRFHTLRGITALAPNDLWAIGSYTAYSTSYRTLTMHWDGSEWMIIPSPSPHKYNTLNAVAGVSANDVWAVGYALDDNSSPQALIIHWDGNEWSVVPTPKLDSLTMLEAVAVVSSTDVWAVGYNGGSALTLHWDGREWSVAPLPNLGRAQLSGVAATATDDVWAVGHRHVEDATGYVLYVMVLHWDGKQWREVSVPKLLNYGHPYNVSALTKDNAWIVGMQVLRWDGKTWAVVPMPRAIIPYGGAPGIALLGIAALSAENIWAVGFYGHDPSRGLIVQYTGSPCMTSTPAPTPTVTQTPTLAPTPTPDCTPGWRVVNGSHPGEGGSGSSELKGVSVISADDVWVVGSHQGAYNSWSPAMHWDGKQWKVLPSPGTGLTDIAAVATDDVWAIGLFSTYHWDGNRWTEVPIAVPDGGIIGELTGIAAVSSNDVWLVGYYQGHDENQRFGDRTLIEHWDGNQWSVVPSPNIVREGGTIRNYLTSIAAVSANDVWVVGSAPYQTLTMHWDGTEWKIIPAPDVSNYNYLSAVAAVSANDVWAVGSYSHESHGATQALVLHWNGAKWSVVPTPDVGPGAHLSGVAAVSANDVWAVGSSYNSGESLAVTVHWDGKQWSLVPGPNPDPQKIRNDLRAVAALPTGDVWAVGTLVMRYNKSPCATPTP